MKKLMTILLGTSLMFGAATVAFAADEKKAEKKEKKEKKKEEKKPA
ncbi:MAG: hypothetical protein SFV18_10630 [Bryobacteraceae bacterium]|jgi:uncharacterized protein YqhQ|nr:hypothetical protein [Bryobacteraceae bacterium]